MKKIDTKIIQEVVDVINEIDVNEYNIPSIAAKKVKFGVELGAVVPVSFKNKYLHYNNNIAGKGVQVKHLTKGWVSLPGASIVNKDEFYSFNLKSPILSGENGLKEILDTVDGMQGDQAFADLASELIIRFSIVGFSSKVKDRIIDLFGTFESMLYAFNGKMCANRIQACPTLLAYDNSKNDSKLWKGERNVSLNRYSAVDGTPLKNEWEIRLFQNQIDGYYVITAVYLIAALIAAAIDGKVEFDDFYGFDNIRAGVEAFIDNIFINPAYWIIEGEPPYDLSDLLETLAKQGDSKKTKSVVKALEESGIIL